VNESKLHSLSFAKKAAAFFMFYRSTRNQSISLLLGANSRSNRAIFSLGVSPSGGGFGDALAFFGVRDISDRLYHVRSVQSDTPKAKDTSRIVRSLPRSMFSASLRNSSV
jgi:hypothetical protein